MAVDVLGVLRIQVRAWLSLFVEHAAIRFAVLAGGRANPLDKFLERRPRHRAVWPFVSHDSLQIPESFEASFSYHSLGVVRTDSQNKRGGGNREEVG
jgi:hypothetical protein